jgi:hypothetical protein
MPTHLRTLTFQNNRLPINTSTNHPHHKPNQSHVTLSTPPITFPPPQRITITILPISHNHTPPPKQHACRNRSTNKEKIGSWKWMRCTPVVLTAVIATVRKGTPLFRYCAQNTRCQRTLLGRGGWDGCDGGCAIKHFSGRYRGTCIGFYIGLV